MKSIEEQIKAVESEVIDWRRYMHEYPELSFQEYKTSSYIESELQKIGDIEISRPTKTSVLGIIKGEKPGKKIGLRADIDALPVQEEREKIAFKSKNDGIMHACGHDGHTAILLGAAKVLAKSKEQIAGEVYLIFQHAEEEPPGGAKEMMETGLFNDLDFIYGQHLFTPIESGKIGVTNGPITSNSDTFDLTIKGKGGHASLPETAIDPIIVGTNIINMFQTIVSRITSPLDSVVISTTKFHAGTAKNIIPSTAMLEGSIRTIKEDTRYVVKEKMEAAVKSICDFYECDYDFQFNFGYSAVINDEEKTNKVREIAQKHFGDHVFEFPLAMGGEDFSSFSREIPGTYAFIGTGNPDLETDYPHHHPMFALDESTFINGVKMMVYVALEI